MNTRPGVRGNRLQTRTASKYPIMLALASAALFGAATPASKPLLSHLSAFQLAGLLYLGAVAGVAGAIARQRSWRAPWRMSRANKLRLSGAVFFGGMAGPVLLLAGLKLASAASVSLWLNLELVATAILGRLLFKDYLGRFGWLGVGGVVAAGLVLAAGEGTAGVWAGLMVAAACLCWGTDNHLTALIDGITPAQSTLWKGLMAGTVNLTIGLVMEPLQASTLQLVAALMVGALAYGLSITLYISAAQGIGATRAQMFFASAPFFGVGLSAILLGERMQIMQLAAAGILVVSLICIFRDRHDHEHEHEALAHEHTHRHDDGHHDHHHDDHEDAPRHSHWHKHEPAVHSHPHWPDLHHRHRHD